LDEILLGMGLAMAGFDVKTSSVVTMLGLAWMRRSGRGTREQFQTQGGFNVAMLGGHSIKSRVQQYEKDTQEPHG
jgi:hypothetical protein